MTRQLFILGGQRHKEFLTDFFTYNIDTDVVSFISDGTKKELGSIPSPGFTQKATIDIHLNTIHILAVSSLGIWVGFFSYANKDRFS